MISKLKIKLAFAIDLVRNGNGKLVWKAFVRRMGADQLAYGFKRDLSVEYAKPRSLISISIREFQKGDEVYFKERQNDGQINEFHTCYVAVTKEGIPCCHLWLIDASQNGKLKRVWGDIFPRLNPDEFLVENVYTVPKYRGAGIFPAVLHEIAEKSKGLGAKYLLSFAETNNINISRSYVYAGFFPYVLRTKRNFLFKRSIFFNDIPDELMTDFNKHTAAYRAKPMIKEKA